MFLCILGEVSSKKIQKKDILPTLCILCNIKEPSGNMASHFNGKKHKKNQQMFDQKFIELKNIEKYLCKFSLNKSENCILEKKLYEDIGK